MSRPPSVFRPGFTRPSFTRPSFTRREALKAGVGLGVLATGASACELPNRCAGGPAATTPAKLLADIDTIVVVMLENRSFDHLLGGLRMDPHYPGATSVRGLDGSESNPGPDGQPVMVGVAERIGTLDPKHDWESSRNAFNLGRNDGFVRINAGSNQHEAMGYFPREQLPLLYTLADQYAVCDHWFSSVMGPTWPNRFYLHAATSEGRTKNIPMGLTPPPTVWERMADRCYTAKNYYASLAPWYSAAFPAKSFSGQDAMTPEPIDRFFDDAARGELPNFALIDPDFQLNDGHPPHDLGLTEAFVGAIHRALAASRHWQRSLLVVTFDEHGGFFDHVSPPTVPDPNPGFQQLGFRVPALVIGPSVRRGAVVSTPFDHVSILATLAARFGIDSLGARMNAANDLSACIDPAAVAAGAGAAVSLPAALPATVQVKSSELLAAPALRRTSQPEVEALALAGRVPRHHIDGREPLERARAWLRRAEALEAVRVVR